MPSLFLSNELEKYAGSFFRLKASPKGRPTASGAVKMLDRLPESEPMCLHEKQDQTGFTERKIMDLETFVTESILGIMRGVRNAQKQTNTRGGDSVGKVYPALRQILVAKAAAGVDAQTIGPEWSVDPSVATNSEMLITHDGDVADIITFDVAVTVQSLEKTETGQETESKGSSSIKVLEVGLGSKRTKASEESSASAHETRIKFRVPICFHKTH